MKSKRRLIRESGRRGGLPPAQTGRKGSVIVVVLVLTLGLLFLGVLLYTDASQEEINAEYYAEASINEVPQLDPEQISYDVLRQIILGTYDYERHSPFYGGRNSLLPRAFGGDRAAFNGRGVLFSRDPNTGTPFVDMNQDGMPDGGQSALLAQINNSPSANAGTDFAANGTNSVFAAMPAPDGNVVYPDVNSAFLFYEGWVKDGTGRLRRVLIPSYLRPQLLRTIAPANQWYTNPATLPYIMRPHQETRALNSQGQLATRGGQPVYRFISPTHPEPTAAGVAPFPFVNEDLNRDGVLDPGEDSNGNGMLDTVNYRFGVWANHTEDLNGNGVLDPGEDTNGNGTIDYLYSLDVDLDGDGVKESTYIDMDLGIFTLPDGSRKFVPIVAVKVVPLDSLFDLNADGNTAKILQVQPDRTATADPRQFANNSNFGFIHGSNQGAQRSEINPQYGLLTPVPAAGAPETEQHRLYFTRDPQNAVDLANMEFWFLKTGRPEYQTTRSNVTGLVTGDYGEPEAMRDAAAAIAAGPLPQGIRFPRAGLTHGLSSTNFANGDDNNNAAAGGAYQESYPTPQLAAAFRVFPQFMLFQPFGHPFDYRGGGQYIQTGAGTGRYTSRLFATVAQYRFPQYANYLLNGATAANAVQWPQNLGNQPLIANSSLSWLIDEPGEMYLDPADPSTGPNDSKFAPGETIFLHMSKSMRQAVNRANDRLGKLAPVNFVSSPKVPNNPLSGTEVISKRFTTHTSNQKAFGKAYNQNYRAWEFTPLDLNGDGTPDVLAFPPQIGTLNISTLTNPNPLDPLRSELRELLQMRVFDKTTRPLQRRLSVNRILDRYPNGRLRFRPLTPHVTGTDANGVPLLGNQTIATVLGANRFNIVRPEQVVTGGTQYHQQEWLARYDRQRLCRDIYMLLYLFGGRNDTLPYNSTANPIDATGNGPVYTAAQLKEMAQFAVNLVDAMDPDDVNTVFEYDTNPANGWGLDDDPFTTTYARPGNALTGTVEQERGQVIGVEAQQLALSEALAIEAKQITDPMTGAPADHQATDYDDRAAHTFGFVELENVTPKVVPFSNASWQIRIADYRADDPTLRPQYLAAIANSQAYIEERRLTFLPPAIGVPAPSAGSNFASRFSIGSHHDLNYKDTAGDIKASYFMVDPNFGEANATGPIRLAPRAAPLDMDLMRAQITPVNRYRISQAQPSGSSGDGQTVIGTSLNPAGREFLRVQFPAGLKPGDISVRVQLRRRLNPHRAEPTLYTANPSTHSQQSADNPWITVDDVSVPLRVFALPDQNVKGQQLRDQLVNQTTSSERMQPLDATANGTKTYPVAGINTGDPVNTPATAYRLNTIGTLNAATTTYLSGRYTLYQPHFDRKFASKAELLSLPLYGPKRLTTALGNGQGGNTKMSLANTAAARFLRPDLPPIPPGTPDPNRSGNRWYRVLELLEVPRPNPNQVPWYVSNLGNFGTPQFPLTQGMLNLNTISHVDVLAGLLDEPNMLAFNRTTFPYLNDRADPNGRDWWTDLLVSRDGIDPTTGLTLPGVPGVSRPFRDLSVSRNLAGGAVPAQLLEETVLRSRKADGDPVNGRRLFEIGTLDQRQNWQNHREIDASTRYRLLSKVMNHTTTRGNAFLVIVQVEYFEAVEVDSDQTDAAGNPIKVVRVGGKLPGNLSPDTRTFYIIDRSRASYLFQPGDFPRVNATTNRFSWSFRQDFYYRPLILSEQRVH